MQSQRDSSGRFSVRTIGTRNRIVQFENPRLSLTILLQSYPSAIVNPDSILHSIQHGQSHLDARTIIHRQDNPLDWVSAYRLHHAIPDNGTTMTGHWYNSRTIVQWQNNPFDSTIVSPRCTTYERNLQLLEWQSSRSQRNRQSGRNPTATEAEERA